MSQPARRLFTVLEFEAMGRSGILHEDDRVELIEGEVIAMSPVGSRHFGAVAAFASLLTRALGDRAIVVAQSPVVMGDLSAPEPDVSVLRQRADWYRDAHPRPRDVLLLVEVADSSLAYDRDVKVALYARWRVAEVWLADLAAGEVVVYREPEGGAYLSVVRVGRAGSVSPAGFADVVVPLREVFGPS